MNMKRIFSLILAAILLLPQAALAETILWEDDEGRVILTDDGSVAFLTAADGALEEAAQSDAGVPYATDEPGLTVEETFTPAPPTQSPAPTPEPSPTPLPVPEKALQYGDSGAHVLAAQERRAPLSKAQ